MLLSLQATLAQARLQLWLSQPSQLDMAKLSVVNLATSLRPCTPVSLLRPSTMAPNALSSSMTAPPQQVHKSTSNMTRTMHLQG